MLTIDLTELLHQALKADRRPPDGKLHPSGDLIGSLRHAQLRAAGAPTIASEIVSDVRLMTGTMWHSYFENLFRGLPVMTEVKLDRWLPAGWSGTADWIIWNPEYEAFTLGDLKTIKGEGMRFVREEGMKEEHKWQASAYYYALEDAGFPLIKGFVVYYLPQNLPTDEPGLQPLAIEGQPIPRSVITEVMETRWIATKEYLEAVETAKARFHKATVKDPFAPWDSFSNYVNDHLAPEQPRELVQRWNSRQQIVDIKLAPHWSAAYCPYPTELCSCRTQPTTKVGHYYLNSEGVIAYEPRAGWHTVEPPKLSKINERRLDGRS